MAQDWFEKNAPVKKDWFAENTPAPDMTTSFEKSLKTRPASQPNSVFYGAIRRLIDLGKSAVQSEITPPGIDALQMAQSYAQGLKTTHEQAQRDFEAAKDISNPVLRTLARARGGATALGGAIPLITSTVENINRLKEEGRNQEAAGQGGMDALLMLLGGTKEGREAAVKPVEATGRGIKLGLQEAGGAGKEAVAQAVERRRALIEKQNAVYQARKSEITERNADAIKDAAQKTADERSEALRKNLERRAEIEGMNAAQRAEWVRKEMAARRGEAQAAAARAQTEVIERGQKAYAQKAIENAKSTFAKVKAGLDTRWNDLRNSIGQMPISAKNIAEAIETAKAKYLMGAPESLTQFKNLMRQMEGDEPIDTEAGIQPVHNLTWEEGRTHYSALGDKMMSGELPGNVRKAVELVRNEIDQELQFAAKKAGKENEYLSVKNDWSQFKKDWDDMSSLSYSKSAIGQAGSPLARLVRAADPAAAARVLGNERLLAQLARYEKDGANVGLAKGFRSLDRRLGEIEKVSVPKHPERVKYKSFSEEPLPEETLAKLKPVPMAPKTPPPIDPVAIRSRLLRTYASRPFRWYDFVTPTGIEHALMKSETIRRLVASEPRNEPLE